MMKEMEDVTKMERYTVIMDKKNIVKISMLPKGTDFCNFYLNSNGIFQKGNTKF